MADLFDESDLDDPGESPPPWFVVLVLVGAALVVSSAALALWMFAAMFWQALWWLA